MLFKIFFEKDKKKDFWYQYEKNTSLKWGPEHFKSPMTAWSVAPLSMSVMKQQKYSPKHGPIGFFSAQSFPTFFLSFKKKMFNASPGSRKDTFHSLSRGLRPNQGHLQVSPLEREKSGNERENWSLTKTRGLLDPWAVFHSCSGGYFYGISSSSLRGGADESEHLWPWRPLSRRISRLYWKARRPSWALGFSHFGKQEKKSCLQLKETHQS